MRIATSVVISCYHVFAGNAHSIPGDIISNRLKTVPREGCLNLHTTSSCRRERGPLRGRNPFEYSVAFLCSNKVDQEGEQQGVHLYARKGWEMDTRITAWSYMFYMKRKQYLLPSFRFAGEERGLYRPTYQASTDPEKPIQNQVTLIRIKEIYNTASDGIYRQEAKRSLSTITLKESYPVMCTAESNMGLISG